MAGIKNVTKGKILVSRVYASDFQKEGSETAELKQTEVTITSYPSKTVDSNLQDNVFAPDDFGYKMQDFKSERVNVAWINVPVGTTPEQVLDRISKQPKAVLYRIVDTHPILSDNQLYAIGQGIATKDQFADKQVIRHGNDAEDGAWKEGDLVLDGLGRPLYKAVFLSLDGKEDINRSSTEPGDFYTSEAIMAEMKSTVAVGQAV